MDLNIERIVEELRTSILWENVGNYIESVEEANKLFQQTDLKGKELAEKVEIQDSEDFYVTECVENMDRIVISFKMPFILHINKKFHIQSIAVGTLTIPNIEQFSYEKYDFSSMNKFELLTFNNIVQISNVEYEGTEIIHS